MSRYDDGDAVYRFGRAGEVCEDGRLGIPQAIGEHLAGLKAEIKRASFEDYTPLIVAARHTAETCRRYMAVSGDLSVAIDAVIAKSSILVEAIKKDARGEDPNIRSLRYDAIYAVEDLGRAVAETGPNEQATILHLPRR